MLPHTVLFRLTFTVRVAFRTPRVSGTDDAHCISRGFSLLSKCVMQRMRAWSLPALLFLSEPVCRSVGRRPEARAHGGKATRPHPLRHPSRRISLGSRRSSARCARTAPDSPFRVVSACDPTPNLINATQSRKPKGFSGFTFLSNCVVQRMRVWSLPALLFLSEPVCRSVGRRPEARACWASCRLLPKRQTGACSSIEVKIPDEGGAQTQVPKVP